MITIIKSGKDKKYFTRCEKCNTEFEYEYDDVKHETYVKSSTENEVMRTVTCPVCTGVIKVALITRSADNPPLTLPSFFRTPAATPNNNTIN